MGLVPIRLGDLKGGLIGIEVCPVKVQADHADEDYPAASTTTPRCPD